MEFWHGFLLITGIHLLAAISPGPDFIFVSQQTLSRGRKAGMICALGVALGLGIHITYSVLGLAVVIAQASWLLTAIKIVGGAYLIWLGVHGLRAKAKKEVTEVRKIEVALWGSDNICIKEKKKFGGKNLAWGLCGAGLGDFDG